MIKALKYIIVALAFVLVIRGDGESEDTEKSPGPDFSKVSDADLMHNCTGRHFALLFDGCNMCFCWCRIFGAACTWLPCPGLDEERMKRGLTKLQD